VPDEAHPTRKALLDAGLELADSGSLLGMSVDVIVAQARVAKGTFYVHFKDRAGYFVALHQYFHEQLRDAVRVASAGQARGAPRLRASTVAYLDACLDARGVKAMLLEARGEPAVAHEVAASNERFAAAAAADFALLGFAHPADTARLFVAMVAETALLELAKGKRRPTLRTALWELGRLARS